MFTPIQMFLFFRRQRGATAIEYGLIIGLIAVVLVAVLILMGTNLNELFDTVAGKLKPPTSSTPPGG